MGTRYSQDFLNSLGEKIRTEGTAHLEAQGITLGEPVKLELAKTSLVIAGLMQVIRATTMHCLRAEGLVSKDWRKPTGVATYIMGNTDYFRDNDAVARKIDRHLPQKTGRTYKEDLLEIRNYEPKKDDNAVGGFELDLARLINVYGSAPKAEARHFEAVQRPPRQDDREQWEASLRMNAPETRRTRTRVAREEQEEHDASILAANMLKTWNLKHPLQGGAPGLGKRS